MAKEKRLMKYDEELKVETCLFRGIKQKFPNHFHDYYVIGVIKQGRRKLLCSGQEFVLEPGALFLLNPYDNHTCEQLTEELLEYHCFHISVEQMSVIQDFLGKKNILLSFDCNVLKNAELGTEFDTLFGLVGHSQIDSKIKWRAIADFMKLLLNRYSTVRFIKETLDGETCISKSIAYLENHSSSKISLNDLSEISRLNKFTLLRNFVKNTGVTPKHYQQLFVKEHRREKG